MGKRILGWFGGVIVFFLVASIAMMPLEEEAVAEQTEQSAIQTASQMVLGPETAVTPTVLSETVLIPSISEPEQETGQNISSDPAELFVVESKEETADSAIQADYILNINSGKFHYPSCPSVDLMNESNKRPYEGNREGAIDQGYVPCQNCNP